MNRIAMIGPVPADWGGLKRHGGVATHVQGLVRAFENHNFQIHLCADNTDAARHPSFPGMPGNISISTMHRSPAGLLRLGPGRLLHLMAYFLFSPDLRWAAPLRQRLIFSGQAANYAAFLESAPYDLVHVQHAEFRQFILQRALRVTEPVIATLQSVNVLVRPHPDWLVRMVRENFTNADFLIAVSNYVREIAVSYGADPGRIQVIPNGVDINRFFPADRLMARQQLGLPQNAFILLFTGNLIPRKGVDVLIQALARCTHRFPELRVVLLGKGPEQDALTRLTEECGVRDRVNFYGFVPLPEIPTWYTACNVFVMPSWAEGLSLSVLEALASGRPVITTHPGEGDHDAIFPGENGFLVPYGDVEALAAALERLVASPELVDRLGVRARRVAEERFGWETVARQTADVYYRVLSAAPIAQFPDGSL